MAEKELDKVWKQWKDTGSREARERLFEATGPVIQQARNTFAGGKETPVIDLKARELAQKAFETYDPDKASLQTHLYRQLQPLTRVTHKVANPMKIPQRTWWDMQNMKEQESLYRDEHGHGPTAQHLADKTGLSLKRIRDLRSIKDKPIPDSALKKEDPDAMLGARDIDEDNTWPGRAVYYGLSPTDQKIMELRTGIFGSEQVPNKEIAQRMGLSAAAVSQRSNKIAEQLREAIEMEESE